MKSRNNFGVGMCLTMYLSAMIVVAGCKKFVEVSPPNTVLVTADVYNSNNAATSAMTAIYTQMFTNLESWTIAQNQGLLADELTNYSSNLVQRQFYSNAMSASNPSSSGEWYTAYKYIYEANAMIAGLQNNKNIGLMVGNQLTGEAKFVRAFWNFYLTNQYGDVPLVTTTEYTVNGSISRTSQQQVYTQIIQDLKDAKGSLNSNYVDASDTATTTDRVRPNQSAAQALLARVYLYVKKYDSAEAQASLVINNALYKLCPALSGKTNSVFLKNSTEAIWQLSTPLPATNNTWDAQNFILVSAPGTGNFNSTAISPQLLNNFEAGDMRKVSWIGVYPSATASVKYYYPYKYQAYNTTSITEYTMVLRLAEQYLIRAEARAQQKNLSGAAADLNIVRNRAGLSNIPDSVATSQSALLTGILHERQVELFAEWGHRWFDLKRTGVINAVMGSPGNVCQSKGGVWNSNSQMYPIAQGEIINDPNLTQNPGY